MAFFKNLFVTFLSFILIILLVLSVVGLSLNLLLSPGIHENALEESGAYDLLEEFEKKGGTGPLQAFTDKPAKEMGKDVSAKLLSYLRGDIDEDEVTLRLNSSKLMGFYEERASNFTVCKKGEQPYSKDEIVCRPQEKNSSEFLKEVLAKKNITIPKETDSDIKLLEIFDSQGKLQSLRESIEIFHKAVYGCLLSSLLIITLIIVIERKDIRAMEQWIGADFLLTGITLFTIVFAGFYTLTLIPPMENQILDKILDIVASPILQRIAFMAFIIFLFACALLILSFISKKNKEMLKK